MSRTRYLSEPVIFTSEDLERAERHRAKGYEEHASYPIEIELPSCAICRGVAARCSCESVTVGVDSTGHYAAKACPSLTPAEVHVTRSDCGAWVASLRRSAVEIAAVRRPGEGAAIRAGVLLLVAWGTPRTIARLVVSDRAAAILEQRREDPREGWDALRELLASLPSVFVVPTVDR